MDAEGIYFLGMQIFLYPVPFFDTPLGVYLPSLQKNDGETVIVRNF
jgi:hypothetical protein